MKERTNVSARRPQRRYIYGMLLTLLLSGLMMGPACDRAKPDSNNKTGQTTNATSNTATAQTSQTQTGGLAKMEKVEIKDVGPAAPSVIMIGRE